MPTEKENIKKELDAIKNNIEKRLGKKENKTSEIVPETPKKEVTKKRKKEKVAPLVTKMEVEKIIPKEETTEAKALKQKEKEKKKEKTTIKTKEKIVIPIKNIKRKKAAKKKKFGLIPIVIILLLIGSLVFIFSLKKNLDLNKKEFEEQSRKEKIDYSEDRYFKEVPDEIEEGDLQDFTVYKNVPEVIVDNNNTNSQRHISSDEQKNIDKQISDSEQIFFKNTNSAVSDSSIANSNGDVTSGVDITNNSSNSKNNSKIITDPTTNNDFVTKNNTTDAIAKNVNTPEQVNNTEKKDETFKRNSVVTIDSDYVKIIGLQYKDDKFVLPKKAKKTNSFKIRTKLTKSILSKEASVDVEVMLVVKDNLGKTIKIDVKTINFEKSKSKIIYLEFYEIFKEKLKIDTEYSFSIFVDRKIIKISKKRI